MMKRLIDSIALLCCIACIFTCNMIYGKVVSVQKAMETAANVFYSKPGVRSGNGSLQLLWNSNKLDPQTRSDGADPAFYIFAPTHGEGFIIISGDDVIRPVLGYSHNSTAPASDDMPPALAIWLEEIVSHIENARRAGANPDAATLQAWQNTASAEEGILLETALWKQGDPLNRECPMDGTKRSITGCVSTAISIIMHYHKWPDAGVGKTEAYVTKTKKLSVPARDLEKPYNWNNMLPEYKQNGYTQEQLNEVTRLLADVGAALQSDYRSNATSATTGTKELYKYFKYDSGMSGIARKDFFADEFDRILRSELDKKRPVLYSGRDDDGGHSFVIDGYDSKSNFHINWGWGGSSNGYFPITQHDYKNKQQAYINIIPATGDNNVPQYWITLYNKGIVPELENIDDYVPREYFMLRILTNNRTPIDFNGYIRAGIVDGKGELKEWIMDERAFELDGRLKPDGTVTRSTVLTCKFELETEPGDKIRIFYRTENTGWEVAMPDPVDWDNDVVWEIPVADQYTIRESTSVKYDNTKKTITFKYKQGVVPSLLKDGVQVNEGFSADNEKIVIDVTKLSGEKYTVRLEKKRELEEVGFSVKNIK